MSVFEVASHQNLFDKDIIACGKRMGVHTLEEAERAFAELADETYPVVMTHIDGDWVSPVEFSRRLSEYELSQQAK